MSRRSDGKPHRQAWRRAKRGRNQCCYCRESFSNRNPPTADHVIPVSRGGPKMGETVLACLLCNNARGNAPFNTYMEAVEAERAAAKAEHRKYRRPRTYTDHNGRQEISTETRRQRADRRTAS